jgi:hypothetical protein
MERRKAMRFRRFTVSQAVPEAKQDKVRLAALHAPRFKGARPKLTSRNQARERSCVRKRKWLFENRIWNAQQRGAKSINTSDVMAGLVPAISIVEALCSIRRDHRDKPGDDVPRFQQRLCITSTSSMCETR